MVNTMKGVIIAAGEGSRFGNITYNKPKPLIELDGKPIIEWVMDALMSGGVDSFVIVVGYLGNKIIKKLGENYNEADITFVNNKNWKLGNLTSLYSARELVNEEFILSMSDHLFDPAIVRDLIKVKSQTTVLLGVDRKYQQTEDDMKVLIDSHKHILNIGKKIFGNFVDIGLFKLKPKIFEYSKGAIDENKFQLYQSILKAAKNKDAMAYDISRRFWIDIDTPEELESYYVQKFPEFIKKRKWD